MDNGVERVDGSHLDQKSNVGNEGFGDMVEERVEVMGSDEPKDVDEEVFEEAFDWQEHLLEQGAKDGVTEEKSRLGIETETFEEAVGVPAEALNREVLAAQGDEVKAVDDLAGGENIDKIDEGGTGELVGSDQLSRASGVFGIPAEAVNNEELTSVDGGTKAEDLLDDKSIDKIDEGGTAEDEGSIGLGRGKEFVKIGGNSGSEIMKGGDVVDSNGEIESRELLPEEKEELKEYSMDAKYSETIEQEDRGDGLDNKPDTGYEESREPIDVTVDLGKGKALGLDNNLAETDTELLDDRAGELKVDAATVDSENGFHEVVDLGDNSIYVDDGNIDMKDITVVVDSELRGQTYEVKDISSVEEAMLIPETIDSPSPEKLVNEVNEEIWARTTDLQSQKNKDSELPHANGVSRKDIVTEQTEKKAEKATEGANQEARGRPIQVAARFSAPPPARGLGRAAPLLEPAPRAVRQPRINGSASHTHSQQIEEPPNGEAEEYDETREKLQMIRVKFLRLARRLGQTPHNVVVAQVLYRLGLAEQLRGRNGSRVGAFSFDRASAMAEQLEAAGQEPLDFSCTIMVLGKTGVGKSATINSIFDEVKFNTDAFQMGTKKVQDVVGTVQGIKVRVIDTPGLLPSWSDQRQNEKILHSVKRFMKKTPPDIVLYLDRLDMQSRDLGDMPLLRTITEIFGPSIWFNAIVVLTHAASAPPDGPNGTASSYDMFVTQRSHVVQQAIRQAAGDMRLMNPVSLVENHSACRTNMAGQRVLPNGQVWKPHLLLLSFASKILAEANALLKLQDSPPGRPFATRSRAPPLPFLLSSLLQSRPQVKLPEEQFGDEDDVDDDVDESSDSEDESEYDDLPPFKSLTKAQVTKLTKDQRKSYFDELEYREKLFMKKQLKEEKRRRRMMKKMTAAARDLPGDLSENLEEESGGAASVPVPMPDLALPASFDSDNPTHRYRSLDSSNLWLVRPVLETHGWDHDVGYEGINAERLFAVKDKIPISFSGTITKDKKDANVQIEVASSVKHGQGKATSLGFDMQTVGKDLAYTLRGETRFSNFRKNKATAGLSVTLLGDAMSTGMKIEDSLIVNKRFRMVVSGGAMNSRGDIAYGGSLEAQLRDKEYPLGRSLSTLGLSLMDWHGDLALGCNIQSQVPIGRSTNLIGRANLNNRGAGQFSIRVNSSEQLQIALVGLIPLLQKLLGQFQLQFGQ